MNPITMFVAAVRGATILMPSSMVDSMNPAAVAVALATPEGVAPVLDKPIH
jgi:hypothetical protein